MHRRIVSAIFAGPLDGASQPVAMIDNRLKPNLIARFRRIAEAMTGMVPIARGLQRDRRCVIGELVHPLGEFANR